MRPPTLHERALVQGALAMFTPWGISHVAPPPLAGSLLESHFSQASLRSDGNRIHALINPVDAGLPPLIREFNQQFPLGSARRLQDSDAMLAVPRFTR